MAAILRITQVGLGAGTDDKTRTDGLLTGGQVTVDSTGPGTVHTLTLLWIPDGDAGTPATFTPVGAVQWTFDPTPGAPGTYILLLDVDGETAIRMLRVRTANLGLMILGLNEIADPAANLTNNGAALIASSQDNEDELALLAALAALAPSLIPKPFLNGNYGGWYRWVRDITVELDDRAAGRMPQGFQAIDSLAELPVNTAVTWSEASDEITLAPTGNFWDVFFGGKRKRFETALVVAIPAVSGEVWVAYDATGTVLALTTNPNPIQRGSLMSQSVMVVVMVVDVPGPTLNVLMVDFRHGLSMSPADKMESQLGLGSLWASGVQPGSFVLGDGSLDTHAQFELSDGFCINQDLLFAVSTEDQSLSPILNVARWLYRSGPGTWRRSAGNASFPTNASSGVIQNANGTSIAILNDGEFVLATYFAVKAVVGTGGSTRDGDRLIAIVGQAVFTDQAAAQTAAGRVLLDLDLDGMPNDLVPVCTVIIQKDTAFANAAEARVVPTATGGAFVDHRRLARNGGVESAPSTGGVAFDPDTILTAPNQVGQVLVDVDGNVLVSL